MRTNFWSLIPLPLVALGSLLLGCTSVSFMLQPIPSAQQQQLWQEGSQVILSEKRVLVSVGLQRPEMTSEGKYRVGLITYLANPTDQPLEFSTRSVKAYLETEDGKRIFLHVYSYEELLEEEMTRQRRQAAFLAFAGALRSMGAGMQSGFRQYSGSISTPQGPVQFSGTVSESGAAAQAQTLANLQTSMEMAQHRSAFVERMRELRNTILKRHTVSPGSWYGGVVIIDPYDPNELDQIQGKAALVIEVGVPEDVHTFRFQLKPAPEE